jgi:uncharacterized repeat protein (TIGR01451 family)
MKNSYFNLKPSGNGQWILSLLMLLTYSFSFASSHREAPLLLGDPLADNVDVYAFRSPDNPNTVTLIATYVPFQAPQGGPNYYNFGENIRYEVHVDNNADIAGDEITYRLTFTLTNGDPTTFFNIRLGQQNQKATYKMEKSTDGGLTFTTIIQNGIVPPTYVGMRSILSPVGLNTTYPALMQSAVMTATTGEKVFAGPTDDPFFVDLGGVFDLGNLPRQGGTPRDGVGCMNVSAIVIQVPIANLRKTGAPATPANILDPNYVIGVWASASRPKLRTLGGMNGTQTNTGDWVQVSRLGMPLTNEVVIPIGMKDYWNSLTPYQELAELTLDKNFYNPELALYMDDAQFGSAVPAFAKLRIQKNSLGMFNFSNGGNGLFALKGTAAVAGTALDAFGALLLPAANSPRSVDLWPIFHTGVPNMRPYQLATGKNGDPLAAGKPFINNFLPNGGDMLRLNMAVPVTPRNDPAFSPLGIIQAAVLGLTDPAYNTTTTLQFIPNMDGFPNGRRLEDDVTLIELQTVAGAALAAIGLWYDDYIPGQTASPVTQDLMDVLGYRTGVNMNDTTFMTSFPYLATPWRGDGYCGGKAIAGGGGGGGGTAGVDLELSITANNAQYQIYKNVTYTITLKNNGTQAATGISVSAKLPVGMVHTSSNATKGVYNLFFERWDVPVLQPGETATLTLVLFALVNNTNLTNFVQVTAQSQQDADSTPNNGVAPTPHEDDEAAVTLTPNLTGGSNPNFAIGDPSNGNLGGTFTNVYPQPAGNDLTVEMNSDMDGTASVTIIDGHGKVVEKSSLQLSKGFNKLNLDITKLNSGMYYIIVDGLSAERLNKRFIVVK